MDDQLFGVSVRDEFAEFWVDDCLRPDGDRRARDAEDAAGLAVLALDAEGFVHLVRQFR